MKIFRNIFAIIGAFVFVLWLAGSLGIGNFALIYTAEKINCK